MQSTLVCQEEPPKTIVIGVFLEAHLYTAPLSLLLDRLPYSGHSFSAGLHANKKHGIGYEYQDISGVTFSARGKTMKGYGINYRFTPANGLYLKGSYGKVSEANYWVDDAPYADYYVWNKGTGNYFAAHVGYHFRNGFLLNLGISTTRNIDFQRFEHDEVAYEYILTENRTVDISKLWLSVSYSFPGRWGSKNELGSNRQKRRIKNSVSQLKK